MVRVRTFSVLAAKCCVSSKSDDKRGAFSEPHRKCRRTMRLWKIAESTYPPSMKDRAAFEKFGVVLLTALTLAAKFAASP